MTATSEPEGKKRSLTRTALLLLPVQVALRAGEALLPLLLARLFGRSNVTDLYFTAQSVFILAASLLFGFFHDSALVPLLTQARKNDSDSVGSILGSILTHIWMYGGAIAVTVGGFTLFAFRHSPNNHSLLVMLPAFVLWLLATSHRTLFMATFHSLHQFFIPPIASFIGMIATLGIIVGLAKRLGIASVPWGMLAGEIIASMTLWAFLHRAQIRFRLTLTRPETVRRFLRLSAADVAGSAITRINPAIDQWMASLTRILGGATILRFASDVASVPTSLVQASLLSPLLSHLSEDAAEGRYDRFRQTIHRAMGALSLVLLGSCGLVFLVRRPVLKLLYFGGQMDLDGIEQMAGILPYLLLGLPAFGILLVLARAHIALQNNRIMLGLGILNAVLNIGFNFIGVHYLGLRGIALSTSFVQIVIALVFYVLLRSRLRSLESTEPVGAA